MRENLVVLAAGNANKDFNEEFGEILTSRIPLAGSLAIFRLIDQHATRYLQIIVCLDQSENILGDVIQSHYQNVRVVYSSKEMNFSDSLKIAFDFLIELSAKTSDLIFGDCLSTQLNHDNEVVVAKVSLRSSWMTVMRSHQNLIFEVSDNSESKPVVVGAFAISDISLFLHFLIEKSERNSREVFFEALNEYDSSIGNSVTITVTDSWQDIGHLQTYFKTKRELLTHASRIFNDLKFNEIQNTVIKSSTKKDKIVSEFLWFKNLPDELKMYSPNVKEAPQQNSYIMNFLESPTLAENWISGNSNRGYWENSFRKCDEILAKMDKYKNPNSLNLVNDLFFEKLEERLQILLQDPRHRLILSSMVRLNGKSLPSHEEVLATIHQITHSIANIEASIMHGDFFFGNLIYDLSLDGLFCLDPRGYRSDSGVYGNQLYDLAKLSHSINSNFDFLSANLFCLTSDPKSMEMNIAFPEDRFARELAEDWFKGLCQRISPVDYDSVRILGASLLISAAPLHYDSTLRQDALILQGLSMIGELI